jgi:hypothetical protein
MASRIRSRRAFVSAEKVAVAVAVADVFRIIYLLKEGSKLYFMEIQLNYH